MGPGLEALLASAAKRGADEMADRCLIENREAAVGVQVFHLRQRWGATVWRAQTQVLLGRLKYALPGWEEAESRRAADTAAEASCRSHASGSGARGFNADKGPPIKKKSVTPMVGGWVRGQKRLGSDFIFDIFYRVFELPSPRNAQKRD